MSAVAGRDVLLSRLVGVLERSSEGRVVLPEHGSGWPSLDALGLDSVGMLNFLVAVEDEFGIEWQDDVPPEVLSSLPAMASAS